MTFDILGIVCTRGSHSIRPYHKKFSKILKIYMPSASLWGFNVDLWARSIRPARPKRPIDFASRLDGAHPSKITRQREKEGVRLLPERKSIIAIGESAYHLQNHPDADAIVGFHVVAR